MGTFFSLTFSGRIFLPRLRSFSPVPLISQRESLSSLLLISSISLSESELRISFSFLLISDIARNPLWIYICPLLLGAVGIRTCERGIIKILNFFLLFLLRYYSGQLIILTFMRFLHDYRLQTTAPSTQREVQGDM